jgi:hypothetical protein
MALHRNYTTVLCTDGYRYDVPVEYVHPAPLDVRGTHPRFVGVTAEDYLVVESEDIQWALTPCCHASAKGSFVGDEPAVVCRHCYEPVDPSLGGTPVIVAEIERN